MGTKLTKIVRSAKALAERHKRSDHLLCNPRPAARKTALRFRRFYRRMAWVVGSLDHGHWDAKPENAREWNIAERFRKENLGVPIRILVVEAPITHYGHIERPRQLAAVLIDAIRWVIAN